MLFFSKKLLPLVLTSKFVIVTGYVVDCVSSVNDLHHIEMSH